MYDISTFENLLVEQVKELYLKKKKKNKKMWWG